MGDRYILGEKGRKVDAHSEYAMQLYIYIYIYLYIHLCAKYIYIGSLPCNFRVQKSQHCVEDEGRKAENCPAMTLLFGIQVPSNNYMLGLPWKSNHNFLYDGLTVFQVRVYHHPKGTTMFDMM